MATGEHYERLLADFIAKGGDPDQCPFDTEDYKYEGPVLKDGEICGG
jgi:hypothetical protein